MMIIEGTLPTTYAIDISPSPLNFLWLEVTGKCNLACSHCYAESSPQSTHGAMQLADWEHVIASAHELGCRSVQFIGGEPTTYPHLPSLIRVAHSLAMRIEVYTNLVSVKPSHWDIFQECNVSLATSFYSARAVIHDQITANWGSFAKTVQNIRQTIGLGLPLRVGLISMNANHDIDEARQFLCDLGVQRIGVDQVRRVGRGAQLIQVGSEVEVPEAALCGHCARGRAAVVPNGNVFPCVFSRWLPVGNVLQGRLEDIVKGGEMTRTRQDLATFFARRGVSPDGCVPDDSGGSDCAPDASNTVGPCMPKTEHYLKTQDLSALFADPCPPHQCPPNTEDGECNPDASCTPKLCMPDFRPCPPETNPPCPPDKEACPPDWDS